MELVRRWPEAAVEGIDSDPEAVSMARKHGLTASVGFAARWAPGPGVDVVVCSGVLQAIPGHLAVLERWVRTLPAGAWVAVMVPNDFGAPSHVVAEELCEEPQWRPQLGGVLRAADVVRPPRVYAQRLAGLGCTVDAWRTRCCRVRSSAGPGCRFAGSSWSPRRRPRERHPPSKRRQVWQPDRDVVRRCVGGRCGRGCAGRR